MEHKPLTSYQIIFLASTFFCHRNKETDAETKAIAKHLLQDGFCIVYENPLANPRWGGGIGNFIKMEPVPSSIDCVKYSFDLKGFLTSSMFKETKSVKVEYYKKFVEDSKKNLEELIGLYEM